MPDPIAARQFAKEVVSKLRDAGFEALWAGGCVRDALLGVQPKDYDVATNATPEQVRALFGGRRTLAIGAAFGVICVLGPKPAGQVEVATFRQDATYTDGRHPDSVTFSTAREDATRRDFTINGLFFDPIAEQVIDYVGGESDLRNGVIRAIGDPNARFDEDKLRLLRAVRFAATLGFDLDPTTRTAVAQHASEIEVVSAERITEEMRRILLHKHRRNGVELLRETRLLAVVLPEVDDVWAKEGATVLDMLQQLASPSFGVALAVLLRPLQDRDGSHEVSRRWKVSNEVRDTVALCHKHESTLRTARDAYWPTLQRVLVHARIDELLTYTAAVARVLDGDTDAVQYCRERLADSTTTLDPPPLIRGDDLQAAGIPPGPQYRQLLERIRDEQLLGKLVEQEDALARARELAKELG